MIAVINFIFTKNRFMIYQIHINVSLKVFWIRVIYNDNNDNIRFKVQRLLIIIKTLLILEFINIISKKHPLVKRNGSVFLYIPIAEIEIPFILIFIFLRVHRFFSLMNFSSHYILNSSYNQDYSHCICQLILRLDLKQSCEKRIHRLLRWNR